jgi:hypothetical protein
MGRFVREQCPEQRGGRMEFSQGIQIEYGDAPVLLEEADDVFSAQRVNVRRPYVIATLATLQNVKGKIWMESSVRATRFLFNDMATDVAALRSGGL